MEPHLIVGEHPLSLPLDPVPSIQEAQRYVQSARDELATKESEGNANSIFWARRSLKSAEEVLRLAQANEDVPGAPMILSYAAIGDLALVGVPAEVFVELGLAVRKNSGFQRTVVLSYTGGYMGYLPTEEAFADGGYEVNVRILHRGLAITPQAGSVMVDESVRLLRSLRTE